LQFLATLINLAQIG